MAKIKKRLGEILIDSGVINEEVLFKALERQKLTGKKLGEVLVEEGYTTNEQIVEAIKNQLSIPVVNLDSIIIKQEIIDIMPENISRKYEVLPLDIINGQLHVVMSDPLNYFAIEEIRIATGYVVKPSIALRQSILDNIEKYYGSSRAREAARDYTKVYGTKAINEDAQEEDEALAPVIKYINTIIENAVLNNASDIHIEPEENEFRVRFRIDGMLREIMRTNIAMHESIVSRIKIMANMNIAEKRLPQDGRIGYKARQKNIDLRVSTVPTVYGEKVVMRVLDKTSFNFSLDTLGMENEDRQILEKIIQKPHGIVLVCGPTGSGKTTTLYSLINILNTPEKNILTIEDPVEYNFKGVNQMQVNTKIGFTFANGLRSILRQDPDIIMVGEIRDNETAEISVRSALTGHLVLSTIHTNDAVGTITRLKDMAVEPFLISSTLVAIVAQRLVRKICPNCGYEYMSSESETRLLGLNSTVKLRKGKGCSICNNTGYKGRVGIYEILIIDEKIKRLIDTNATEKEIEDAAIENGMTKLREAAKNKVIAGITTIDEMLRVTFGY